MASLEQTIYRVTVVLSTGVEATHQVQIPHDLDHAVAAVIEHQQRLNKLFEEGSTLEMAHPSVTYNSHYVVCLRYDFPNSGELERRVAAEPRSTDVGRPS